MIKLTDLENFILKAAGRKKLNHDEGRIFGLTNETIKKAVVCWMPNGDAIEFAAEIGADAIICHESLFYPYDAPQVVYGEVPKDYLSWSANAKRLNLLVKHDIGVYRIHVNMDRISNCDALVNLLKLGKLVHRDLEKLHYIVEFPPQTLDKLASQIKARLNMKQLWTVGPRDKKVRRAGMIFGGGGLFTNVFWAEEFISMGCDVLVCGESDEYAMEYFKDAGAGAGAIVTSHRLSENPGVEQFANSLSKRFKGHLKLQYFAGALPNQTHE
ncbi:MAG: Nif3-like dinuclear metal center hexameric protein [Verrucomicrobiae bacterium]|nr:Nif3-like dinuclear metal center hexameric protein [Verrucomicrobiae bacterium]